VDAALDTNILVDYLAGHEVARAEFRRYERRVVSIVTYIEVLVGCRGEDEERAARTVLAACEVLGTLPPIVERAILIRRQRRLKLPDSLILATAQQTGCLLVTRNRKDFPAGDPAIRVPYQL
jgi:predicted nucleic acid-binding protein